MPPKRNKGRKKDQKPPLAVQGLLHLASSFVTPKQTESQLATVTLGNLPLYGYGDEVSHTVPEEPAAASVPTGPGGDAPPQPPPPPTPPPPPPPLEQPPRKAVEKFYSELAASAWPVAPPMPPGPDMDDPEQYEPPEFASQPVTGTNVGVEDAPVQEQVSSGDVPPVGEGLPSATRPVEDSLGGEVLTSGPSSSVVEAAVCVPATGGLLEAPVTGEEAAEVLLQQPAAADGMTSGTLPQSGDSTETQAVPPSMNPATAPSEAPEEAPPLPPAVPPADTAPLPEPAMAQPDVPDPTALLTSLSTVLPEQCGAHDDGMLSHYWQFVRENPYDFNGWTYLLQHVEKQTNLDAIRAVYNAFLPLYPYCYAYWKKYADLEQRSGYKERSLEILERGVKAIPLSVDLWMSLLNQTRAVIQGAPDAEQQIRALCERAIASAGRQFRADELWECFLSWESANGVLYRVTAIYRRLLHIPTRLYNRHWDNFLQHIRDYHPRDTLPPEEYLPLRRDCCLALGMPHREEPPAERRDATKTEKPEVKLIAAIKERVVAEMVTTHEVTEKKVERRWKLEDKIKRPYFHVVPLDRRQLRAWREYLQLEASDGDHHSMVLLYERCLIACAQYEEFWTQYARYLERRLDSAAEPAAEPEAGSERPPADPAATVREVYKRACLVHCPTKPLIRLQWAAFEESRGERVLVDPAFYKRFRSLAAVAVWFLIGVVAQMCWM